MNSLKKKCQVVMLSTEKASGLLLGSKLYNKIGNNYWETKELDYSVKRQHLYFLSDDKTKEGDWVKHGLVDLIYQVNKDNLEATLYNKCKKIIATTDSSLKLLPVKSKDWDETPRSLPQPSPQFIEKYIEEYNKGNIITECMVEYILNEAGNYREFDFTPELKKKLKIDSNNCITITKVNQKGEHILKFVKDFINEFPEQNLEYLQLRAETWIENNL